MAESFTAARPEAPSSIMTGSIVSGPQRATRRRGERVEFYLFYACCFGIILAAVTAQRALVLSGILAAPTGAKLTLVQEAREAVGAVIPYVFMG
jgi:hypothetical protein